MNITFWNNIIFLHNFVKCPTKGTLIIILVLLLFSILLLLLLLLLLLIFFRFGIEIVFFGNIYIMQVLMTYSRTGSLGKYQDIVK